MSDRGGKWVALASGEDGVKHALPIHQDATLYGAMVPKGTTLHHVLKPGRRAYLVVADGAAEVNGTKLDKRDGAAITDVTEISLTAQADTDALLMDLP